MILDPIVARLQACWLQLHGPTGAVHRVAILAAVDRHLDAWLDHPPATADINGLDDPAPRTPSERETA